MYVSYEQFLNAKLGGIPHNPVDGKEIEYKGLTESQYAQVAPIADAIIDNWTLDRVGRAVKNGETLPDIVVTVYGVICESIPDLLESSKVGSEPIESFSNGIDSYTFAATSDTQSKINDSLGWLIELLPIEWCSACVSFEGGNRYAS